MGEIDEKFSIREIIGQIVSDRGIDEVDTSVPDFDEATLEPPETFLEILRVSRNAECAAESVMQRTERYLEFANGGTEKRCEEERDK